MPKVRLTYRPTRDPKDEQPGYVEMDSVAAALVGAYELRRGKGYHAGIEIRKDKRSIYDENSLSKAVDRVDTLVNDENIPLEKAAKQVAEEDGHSD